MAQITQKNHFFAFQVTAKEMDHKILSSLCEFADATGVQIVEHFAEADMSSIRNKCGYLAGVMKRFRQERGSFGGGFGGGMGGGYGAPGHGAPLLPPPQPVFQGAPAGVMWPSVQKKLDALFATGVVLMCPLSVTRDARVLLICVSSISCGSRTSQAN